MTALPAGRHGFTLLEVLVGLTVAAVALTAGFVTLSFVGDRAHAAEASTVEALAGATTRELLVDWLRGARFQTGTGTFQGTDDEDGDTPNDELSFPTSSPTPLQSRSSRVRLFIDRDDTTPEQGLVAELTERLADEPTLVELVPEADGFDVRFWPDGEEVTEWLPDWNGQAQLPRTVEIVLTPARNQTLPDLLRYPIRVSMLSLR